MSVRWCGVVGLLAACGVTAARPVARPRDQATALLVPALCDANGGRQVAFVRHLGVASLGPSIEDRLFPRADADAPPALREVPLRVLDYSTSLLAIQVMSDIGVPLSLWVPEGDLAVLASKPTPLMSAAGDPTGITLLAGAAVTISDWQAGRALVAPEGVGNATGWISGAALRATVWCDEARAEAVRPIRWLAADAVVRSAPLADARPILDGLGGAGIERTWPAGPWAHVTVRVGRMVVDGWTEADALRKEAPSPVGAAAPPPQAAGLPEVATPPLATTMPLRIPAGTCLRSDASQHVVAVTPFEAVQDVALVPWQRKTAVDADYGVIVARTLWGAAHLRVALEHGAVQPGCDAP